MRDETHGHDSETLSSDEKRALLKEILRARAEGAREKELLSHGQRALWFMSHVAPESPAYNWVFKARLLRRPDLRLLERTIRILFERHGQLRATIATRSGEPVLGEPANPENLVAEIDAAAWTPEELAVRVRAQARRPFDLERGPLIRVTVFSRAGGEDILLVVTHHLIMDARSLELFLDDAQEVYGALENGLVPDLAPIASSYGDFVKWQEDLSRSPRGEMLRSYWMDRLGGELPVLSLPTDRPRPAMKRYRGESLSFRMPAELAARIDTFAAAERSTAFVVVLAAFQAFLSRYTKQVDILVAAPMAGRTREEFERVIGFFVNPVILRADLAADPTFRAFVAQVRETVVDALAHQDYPFPLLVEQLHPRRDPSYSPIFQAMLDWHGLRTPTTATAASGGLALEPIAFPQQEGQFDLTLDIFASDNGLDYAFKYDVDLFNEDSVDAMAHHFETLLRGALENPDARILSLPLLQDDERQKILVDWNDTRADYPEDKCIHELFEEQSDRSPDAIALSYNGAELTYSELRQRASELARKLRARGVGPDTPVGIYADPSVEMIVGLLGILAAGGAYLPLDPTYPLERLAYMLSDSGTSVLLTQRHLRDRLPSQSAEIIYLDDDGADETRENLSNGTVTPRHLAYVIYTSGSTGKPKGVRVSHRSVVNLLSSIRRCPGVTADDVFLAVTTISFDIHALELFVPLTTGARLVVVDRPVLKNGRRLLEKMRSSRASIMQATPSTWHLLIQSGWTEPLDLKILCGGEPLSPALADQLLARGRELWNMYGPTETTVWSSVHRVRGGESIVSVGRPIDNTQFYILDNALNPVPPGILGELYIAGDGLALGYANRHELTAERFVPNPFIDETLMYRTGDWALYRRDGLVEAHGRTDHQIKLRGFRIEPGEIESALRESELVREAIAIVQGDLPSENRIIGYLIAEEGRRAADHDLRKFLRDKLPDYMIPSVFVWLDAFPEAPNGKVDRGRLPAPSRSEATDGDDYEAPQTELEIELARIWSEVLDADRIALYDNFFELGGHSLLSMRVVDLFEKRTGHRMKPEALVGQTLKQAAARFAEDHESASWKQRAVTTIKSTLFGRK